MTREPECRCAMDTDDHAPRHCQWCICDRLQAARQRGIADARNAVAAIDACPECSIDDAIAAIDALRGDRGE